MKKAPKAPKKVYGYLSGGKIDLSGLSAEQLAEYLCLREIERWAETNLSIS